MRVLFLGEGVREGPARYLAAIFTRAGIAFDHRPDRAKIPKAWRSPHRYSAVILSDYRYASFTPCAREWLECEVSRGVGLLMIGGYASFTGTVGGYAGTSIERMLPVRCKRPDDRVNWPSGSLVVKGSAHPVREGLSFAAAPIVCGYHRVELVPKAEVVLALRDLTFNGEKASLGKPHPLLVLGRCGKAKTAAFLTDNAPHWAGGLVDWGARRVRVPVTPALTVEVGEEYLRLFERLVRWLAAR